MLSTLKIICEGADAPHELWLYLMSNFLAQLRSLDDRDVAEQDTQRIVEYLYDIFTSETLGKHIAKVQQTSTGFPLLGNCFFFGLNRDMQNENRLAVRKWLEKAQDTHLVKPDLEISDWIKLLLDNPLKLLVPLAKICVKEWLACNKDRGELYWRHRFAWRCIISVSILATLLGHVGVDN